MSAKYQHVLMALAGVAAWSSHAIADAIPAEASPSALSYIGEVQRSPRLREITLKTPLLIAPKMPFRPNPTGETKVRVLLPEGYDPNGARRYPVLYLLHGGGADFTEWTRPDKAGKAEELTAGLPLIVVMPDCGGVGGYADWYNGGVFGTPQWRTYHLDQLVPWIDAHFLTIPNRAGRAVAGLSMGGNGAISYASRRPDLFGAVAPFSGSVDLTKVNYLQEGPGEEIGRLTWGSFPTNKVRWRGDSGPDMAKNLTNTDISLYTGDAGDPEGTFILAGTLTLHQRLQALGIAHRYVLYPGMSHSWPTWNKALADWLPHLMARFSSANASASQPPSFSYSTIEPNYSVYGWSVAMQRPAVEFSALEVAGSRNFAIIGSGSATIRTPVLGRSGRSYRLVIARTGEPSKTQTLIADGAGRLSVPLQLGPGNRFQQYTAEADASATGPAADRTPFRLANNGSHFYRVDVKLFSVRE